MSRNAKLLGLAALALIGLIATLSDWGGAYRAGFDEAASADLSVTPGIGEPPLATTSEGPVPEEEMRQVLPTNDKPPDPAVLAGKPELQQAFDDAAEPGQFVTPPNVGTGGD